MAKKELKEHEIGFNNAMSSVSPSSMKTRGVDCPDYMYQFLLMTLYTI